jgi:hypothetical protein
VLVIDLSQYIRLYRVPNKTEPDSPNVRNIKNTLGFTIPQTAIMAGRVVTGPAIRKASTAPGFIPRVINPLTSGNAVKLVV